ncbi:MAG: transmembrane anchor protein [Rhodobacteraceae bacterium]|nr:transmembrane anchor protein [Paracoccaceae bacterium]
MYNSNKPDLDELPSSAQLLKSTIIAAVVAVVLLITVILPAEYGIDPTRTGQALGLVEMGEIKMQLQDEAEADRQMQLEETNASDDQSSLIDQIFGVFIGAAHAQSDAGEWTDKISLTLTPGQGKELKLVMQEGAAAEFSWSSDSGVVNYDLHGDGSGKEISYEKGRGVPGQDGVLVAAFTGNHGWFWRNRTKQDVTLTLLVRGDYSALKLPD